jgi:ribosomal protein L37AE/L43A
MISKHCGQRLRRVSTDREAYINKAIVWRCDTCGRFFAQGLRKAKGQEELVQRKNIIQIWDERNTPL